MRLPAASAPVWRGHPPLSPVGGLGHRLLGQGLAVTGVGSALAGKYHPTGSRTRTWVVWRRHRDAEGSVLEALDRAAYYGLSNLTRRVT